MSSLKVAHVSTNAAHGGAAIAAARLHRALLTKGVDSTLLFRYGPAETLHGVLVEAAQAEKAAWMLEEAVQQSYVDANRSALSNTLFTLDYVGTPIHSHPTLTDVGVVNLHWTSLFQSVETLSQLVRADIPIVWTMHDMWPFTGGCHYAAGCEGFTNICARCPQLGGDPARAAEARLQDKVGAFAAARRLVAVSPSAWLAEQARRSTVFRSARVEVIPNSVDTAVFKPLSRSALRSKFGIPPDALCIAFGSVDHTERRKGFAELLTALSWLKGLISSSEGAGGGADVRLLSFGKTKEDGGEWGFPLHDVKELSGDPAMAEAYACADIFVIPSLEDNLPNTVLEAMSCGVPVVGFSTGGIAEAVVPGETGLVARTGDTQELAQALFRLLGDVDFRRRLGAAGRVRAERLYSPSVQAQAYIKLYHDLVEHFPMSTRRARLEKPMVHGAENALEGVIGLERIVPAVLATALPSAYLKLATHASQLAEHNQELRAWAERTEAFLKTEREITADLRLQLGTFGPVFDFLRKFSRRLS